MNLKQIMAAAAIAGAFGFTALGLGAGGVAHAAPPAPVTAGTPWPQDGDDWWGGDGDEHWHGGWGHGGWGPGWGWSPHWWGPGQWWQGDQGDNQQ